MKRLELTLDSPAANLALDEALLETAEADPNFPEVLRIWEPVLPLVVLGRSSPVERETNLEFCRQQKINVLRRCSGGQSIVTGPGCLMYAVLLDYRKRPELRMLETAHQFVMTQVQQAIKRLDLDVQMEGTSDLTYQGRKFSGNSLRCKKNWLIYHGTLLCDFDLDLIANCLGTPIREPDYRQNRTHLEFLTQLPVTKTQLRNALIEQWDAAEPLENWPQQMTRQLAVDKYESDTWTFKVR
jgi:lipoate-protein ligase A